MLVRIIVPHVTARFLAQANSREASCSSRGPASKPPGGSKSITTRPLSEELFRQKMA